MENLKKIVYGVINELIITGIGKIIFPTMVAFFDLICSIYEKQTNIFLIIIIYAVYLALTIIGYKFKFRRIASGREKVMGENTKLIKKPRVERIYSTRVTYWLLNESSPNRTAFRSELTKRIESGIEVKRLWHIRSHDDVERLVYYLNEYEGHDNLSVKCITGNDIILPELLISYPYAAAISLPQENSPRQISMAYHFKRKKDITYWTGYFNILWESAIHIFISGKRYDENIKMLRDMYPEEQNKNDVE